VNIVLIGYRGTGKSTVGRLLAVRLGRTLVSLDEEIVRMAGCGIPEIVAAFGWPHFRDLEASVVEKFSSIDRLVIDTGGGVILRQSNVDRLRRNGFLIWLTAPPAVIIERIQGETQRPALTPGKTFLEEVRDVLAEREPLYRAAADAVVDTSGVAPEEICAGIVRMLEKNAIV
jgi:shikimate kinase